MNKENFFGQVYINLENEVLELAKYIYFTDTTTKIDNKTKQAKYCRLYTPIRNLFNPYRRFVG